VSTRHFDTLGRRILAVLELGPRKFNVLLGAFDSETRLRSTLKRLRADGQIVLKHQRGGVQYALPKRRTA